MIRMDKGFTLVELAMVLFIISLLLGGLLGPLSTRLEGEERRQTTATLNEIRDSLIAYAMVNGHLPCPDCPASGTSAGCGIINTASSTNIGDGQEDLVAGASMVARSNPLAQCATAEGNIPWVTLGVTQLDAWGNRFGYRVTDTFADNVDGTGSSACAVSAGVSFQICSQGNIRVNDAAGTAIAQNIPALVISYGKNANDAGNPSSIVELANQNAGSAIFVDTIYSTNPAVQFDDILSWIPPNTLVYRMVQAERLP